MRRVLSYLSRPHIFAFTLLLLFGLAAATWSLDRYWNLRSPGNASEEYSSSMSTAARIVQRDRLVVGVRNNVAPFGFVAGDGTLSGFDVDIAREFARRWLGSEDALELTIVTAADRIPLLVSDEIDLLIAAMPNRRDRDALVDFSRTYFEDRLGLLVRSNSEFTEVYDLHDHKVAVLSGSSSADTLGRESSRQEISILLQEFSDYAQALDSLGIGDVDAIAANSIALVQMARGNPGLRVINTTWDRQPYSIGVSQGESRIRSMVNFTLEDMKQDGTYDQLYQKWFVVATPVDLEHSPGDWSYNLSQLPQESPQASNSPLDRILDRGYIIAGVPNGIPPFGFLDEQNEWAGFDIDVIHEFARRWLGDESAIKFVPDEIVNHVGSLERGEIDLVAAGMIMRREWAYSVDFSQSYLGPPVVNEPLGVALSQNAPKFRELVNFTLQEMKKDGLYDTLHVRWFGPDLPIYSVETWPGEADYLLASYHKREVPVRITAPRESTIKRIRQRGGIMRVGISVSAYPFGFLDNDGELNGFDVDLAKALATDWGLDIGFVPQERGEQITQLLRGEVDLVGAGLVHTKQREEEIDFSQTYFINGQNILMRSRPLSSDSEGANSAGENFDLARQEESLESQLSVLAGGRIAVAGSLSISDQTKAFLDSYGIFVELTTADSLETALDQLRTGDVDAVVADNVRLAQVAQSNPNFQQLSEPFTKEPYALGLAPGDSYFQNLINDTLQRIKRNGTYDGLHQKWFGTNARPLRLDVFPQAWPYTFETSPTSLDTPTASVMDRLGNITSVSDTTTLQTTVSSASQTQANSADGNRESNGRRRLVVGIKPDAKPFSFIEENGRAGGLEVDIVRNMAARWLGDPTAVSFVPQEDNQVGQALINGDIDLMIGGITQNSERQEAIDFSQTYYRNELTLALSEGLISELLDEGNSNGNSIEASSTTADTLTNQPSVGALIMPALNGKTIAIWDDPVTVTYLQKLANQHQVTFNILPYDNGAAAVEAIQAGLAGGFAGTKPIVDTAITALGAIDLALGRSSLDGDNVDRAGRLLLLDDLTSVEPYAIGLPIHDEQFRDLVNFTLQEMQADGTLGNLVNKWLSNGAEAGIELWPGESYFQHDLVPMTYIPPSEFLRGNKSGFPDERIERDLALDGYYIDQFEVTNRQYDRCVRSGFCETPRLPRSINFSRYFAQSAFGNYPVIWVSWYDAAEYCDYVGKRLPTEAEWERAARGPDNTIYPWGNSIPVEQSNFDYLRRDVVPIGSFPQDQSPYGVYDLAGNVREWVSDWYEWDYYQVAPQSNPKGPESGVTKVLRGGSWNDTAVYVRSTVRRNFLPESVDANLGFRCASSKPPLGR